MTPMSPIRCCYFLILLAGFFCFPANAIIIPCTAGNATCAATFQYSGLGTYSGTGTAPGGVSLSGIVKVIYGSSGCTGELISAFSILTAGHCINPYVSSTPTVTFADGTQITGSYIIDPTYAATINPSTGLGTSTLGSDLAVINLISTAPSWATVYGLYSGTLPTNQTLTVAGYGNTGVGLSGDSGSGYGTLRAGQNVYLGNGATTYTIQGPTFNQQSFDLGWSSNLLIGEFDNGYAAYDSLGYLGNSNTVIIDHGDSGGPTFYNNGGVEMLIGVHDLLTCVANASQQCVDSASTSLNGAYGQIFADTSVAGNMSFILSAEAPEPATWALIIAALPVVVYLRRRRLA